jgi:hypothetical protein
MIRAPRILGSGAGGFAWVHPGAFADLASGVEEKLQLVGDLGRS